MNSSSVTGPKAKANNGGAARGGGAPQLSAVRLAFEVEGLTDRLDLVRFTGADGLSQLFEYHLDLAAASDRIDFSKVVGRPAKIVIDGGADVLDRTLGYRERLHGIVRRFEQRSETGQTLTSYRATIVPSVWRLTRRVNYRIFQYKTVNAIVKKVLEEAGLEVDEDFEFKLDDEPPEREYCVQYRESDWAFISRLLEEEGIYYYFAHGEERAVLTMAAQPQMHAPITGGSVVRLRPPDAFQPGDEHIHSFSRSEQIVSGAARLRDYDFEQPHLVDDMEAHKTAEHGKNVALEVYEYPGGYRLADIGEDVAQRMLQGLQAAREVGSGASTCPRLVSGHFFELTGHARFDESYVLTDVLHSGFSNLNNPGAPIEEYAYSNTFRCIPRSTPFRPAPVTPKPVVEGVQTAEVVGPGSQEIYTNEHRQVKVKFHWDRAKWTRGEDRSCWIRVGQVWTGQGWGAMWIPRVGQEVIVSFVEGDPDRPLITGRVYNGANAPPYQAEGEETKSTIKSNSTPGGGGSNELTFDDAKGAEEIYIHAERDQNEVVENDMTTRVRANQTLTVNKNRDKTIDENETTTVKGNRTETVEGDEWITIEGKRTETVEGDEKVTIRGNRAETVDKNETIIVGGRRSETVAKNESISIDGTKTEMVAKTRTVSVDKDNRLTVKERWVGKAKEITFTAQDRIRIVAGKASITLKKDGTILIRGKKIKVSGTKTGIN